MVLILDTNILPKIIDGQESSRIDKIFSNWIKTLCDEISPSPEGKIVTIVASCDMTDDYKAGLYHCHYPAVAKTFRIIFNKSFSDAINTGDSGRARLMLEKVKPKVSTLSSRIRDSHDRRFLDVLIYVAESKGWKDRQILLVTADRKFREDAESALAPSANKRIHIASDMNAFGHMFAC